MTTRRLLISFFLMYAILILVTAQEFVSENTSASIAMIGSCIIIAILFVSKRISLINIILAVYVFQNYLTRPFISILRNQLSPKNISYVASLNSYYTPDAAAVVYWSLFSLLLAWLMGLLLIKSPEKDDLFIPPKIFTRIDQVILKGRLPFWLTWGLLIVLNYQSPEAGLRATTTGEGGGAFLWGLASLTPINFVCLYLFLKRQHAGLKPAHYSLLLPVGATMLFGVLHGSRGSIFLFVIMGLVYWLALNSQKKWELQSVAKVFLVGTILLPITVLSGLFAQVLRPIYRYTDSVDATDILGALSYKSVMMEKESLLFGITELLHRLSGLKAQFYILNNWYVHNPWQYYNPLSTTMRIVNDFWPSNISGGYEPFEGMLTINQLFDYIYHDTALAYNSEMWSIQGTLYLYFGHFLAPIVVCFMGVLANRIYPSLERSVKASPSFAVFIAALLFAILTNGTAERVISVHIVRPVANFVVFLVLYKAFSLFLQFVRTGIWLSKREYRQHHHVHGTWLADSSCNYEK